MKRQYFIKFDPRIKRLTGCDRAALILEKVEFWFSRQPDGFYKFIEPCSHRLYREGDSWAEELGCDRKCFARAWKKIGVKHKSRLAFEAAEDKFDGKLYASFYDRYTNRMFFIRNHELADKTLQDYITVKKQNPKVEADKVKKTTDSLPQNPVSTGHNVPSYKDASPSSSELSKDNSHASNEIIKKMVELWTAIVQEGRGQIKLEGKLIPYLKKALKDKFNNCLQKWKEYCISIARSKFLMGEKKSWNGEENTWKADLMWALKFESIRKVLAGQYGIGDRARELTAEEVEQRKIQKTALETERQNQQRQALEAAEQGIRETFQEPAPAVEFRVAWLRKVGAEGYRKTLEGCSVEVGENGNALAIHTPCNLQAKQLVNAYGGQIESLVQRGIAERVRVFHQSEFTGLDGKVHQLVVDRWFGEAPALEEPIQALELSPASLPEGKAAQEQVTEPLPEGKETFTQLPGELEGIVSLQAGPLQAANQDNPPEAPVSREMTGGLVAPLPQVAVPNPQTLRLQGYLRDRVPNAPQPFLEGVRFEGAHQSRDLVIFSFGDGLAAQFYQKRYERELLQAARDLWAMSRINVVSREGDCPDSLASVVNLQQPVSPGLAERDVPQAPCDVQVPEDEAGLVQKALLALRRSCFKLDDAIPF